MNEGKISVNTDGRQLAELGRKLNARGLGTAEWHEDWLIQEMHQTEVEEKVRPLTDYYPAPDGCRNVKSR